MTREEAVAMFGEQHVAICEKFVTPPDYGTLEGRMYCTASMLMHTAYLAAERLRPYEDPPVSEVVARHLRRRIKLHLRAVQLLYPEEELDALIERNESLYGFSREWREWDRL